VGRDGGGGRGSVVGGSRVGVRDGRMSGSGGLAGRRGVGGARRGASDVSTRGSGGVGGARVGARVVLQHLLQLLRHVFFGLLLGVCGKVLLTS
jgi:hypothetical protein